MSFSGIGAFEPPDEIITSMDHRQVERIGSAAIATNTAWVANLVVFVPFRIAAPLTVGEWFWYNGTLTTAYNVDCGIYREDFTRIQSLGTTAGTTTASVLINTSTWTDLVLGPGSYYMAWGSDSTRNFTTDANVAGIHQAVGIMEQSSGGYPLPATATPVAYTRAFLPLFGMNCRGVSI